MPKELSKELKARLAAQRGNCLSPLPVNQFVTVHWPLDGGAGDDATEHRCYSTFDRLISMGGWFYSGKNRLLDFNEESDSGFVMTSDDLIYGASCGFRVVDDEGLAAGVVYRANARDDFPPMFAEVWTHFSDEPDEVQSLLYGKIDFGGFITRIELQESEGGKRIAKVWGGYQGIAVSKERTNMAKAASAVGLRVSLNRRVADSVRRLNRARLASGDPSVQSGQSRCGNEAR